MYMYICVHVVSELIPNYVLHCISLQLTFKSTVAAMLELWRSELWSTRQVHIWFNTAWLICGLYTVKSFYFVGTKFHGLMMDMFVDTWICGFQIILNITKVNWYLVELLNSWIVPPTKYKKLNAQQIKMTLQYLIIQSLLHECSS